MQHDIDKNKKSLLGDKNSETATEEVKTVEKGDASLVKIVLLVNLGMILYTSLQTVTKDMLTYRGVKIYEFVFFRSFFNMCCSAIIIKQ